MTPDPLLTLPGHDFNAVSLAVAGLTAAAALAFLAVALYEASRAD